MNSTGHNRRQLLKGGAALAGLALAGVRPASAAEAAVGIPNPGFYDPEFTDKLWPEHSVHPAFRITAMADLLGIITPNRLAFAGTHRDLTPNIDAHKHTLLVHGLVDRPMTFTMEDLRRLPSVSRV